MVSGGQMFEGSLRVRKGKIERKMTSSRLGWSTEEKRREAQRVSRHRGDRYSLS